MYYTNTFISEVLELIWKQYDQKEQLWDILKAFRHISVIVIIVKSLLEI